MKNKRTILLSFFSILLILLSACAFRFDESSNDSNQMDMVMDVEESAVNEPIDRENDEVGLDLGEKIIENASLSYETVHFEKTINFINKQLDGYEARLEKSSKGQASSSDGFIGEYVSMTIRLPKESLNPFIDVLNEYDDLYLQNEEISRVDVTKAFRDNETRLEVLGEEEDALRKMLQEQGSLEEILQIRTRLSEVISEREIYENDNKHYADQAEFSTIYLYVQQSDRATTRDVSGFWDRLKTAFVDSFYRFITVAQNLAIGFVYSIPYLIILVLVTIIFYFAFRAFRKNK